LKCKLSYRYQSGLCGGRGLKCKLSYRYQSGLCRGRGLKCKLSYRYQSGVCRGRGMKCKLIYRYQRFADSKLNTLQYNEVQLYTHVIKGYKSFSIGRCKASRCIKKSCLINALVRM
jgi:hypothetical protein